MDLKIGTETISFLKSLDHNRIYKGKYQKQKEVKAKRSQSNNDKIMEQMEQQKKIKKKALTVLGLLSRWIPNPTSYVRKIIKKGNC